MLTKKYSKHLQIDKCLGSFYNVEDIFFKMNIYIYDYLVDKSTYPRNVAPFKGKALSDITTKPRPNILMPPSA